MNSKKNLKRNLLICLLAGSAVMYTLPLHAATSVIANNTLPTGGKVFAGDIKIPDWAKPGETNPTGNLEMNIIQSSTNGVIKWESFNVGGSATVNFKGPQVEGGYNTLNYVNAGGSMSQIYGTINANNNGNIFIVNPAGVQIGNSAQINVGSLYVSNKTFSDDLLKTVNDDTVMNYFMKQGTANADAALMSLGNINANKVTFEGDGRIVIDSERLKDVAGTEKLTADKIFVNTKDKNNVVIGYDAYENGSYAKVDNTQLVTLNGSEKLTKADGYMWVEDVEQLQAIYTNLGGNYALRNSIDATSTATAGNSFISIGSDNNAFIGKFDGIDYNIFGLTIDNNNKSNTGLFGETNGATINNVTLVGGKITGGNNTGALVGHAINSTITNVVNSAEVNGDINVGGFIGASTNSIVENAVNTGSVHSDGGNDNKGGIVSSVGGLIGSMTGDRQKNSQLTGNSYNLGNVSGNGYNVGGLVGHAVNSTIGDGTNLVYNRLDVTGAYNVGGIVGNMKGSTVQYAENSGTVTATEYTEGEYIYHTDNVYFDETYGTFDDRLGSQEVNIANVGGIAGTSSNNSSIENVTNSGDISSNKQTNKDYYDAGNVGGIVGSAVDTNITNATNRENEVRGAHNVGGVAGYFGNSNDADSEPDYTITTGINDGGDIMATGARCGETYFGRELVRYGTSGGEENIIGNIGGVVGYLDGDNVYVTGSANRGNVHSLEITNTDNVSDASKAANTGGVVGKIDRNNTASLDELKNKKKKAAVSNSYNTGDVRGYMGVGGVVGMMYNGEVMSSYNLGTVNTTRKVSDVTGADLRLSVNMGGVVGDTTEQTSAHSVLYDVYNKGQIGDDTFTFYSRHVGGIVGRLSGYVDKAYNTGAIYNGYNVVGGIAGWFYKGGISNSFNTGNITVVNNNNEASSQVGGIVGAAGMYANVKEFNRDWQDWTENSYIKNVYNLGTIRSFDKQGKGNSVGGIIGYIAGDAPEDNTPKLNIRISNVYTTGNLYAQDKNGKSDTTGLGSIIGLIADGADKRFFVENAYYIKPDDERSFTVLTGNNNNANKTIEFDKKDEIEQYQYDDDENGKHYSLTFTQQEDGDVDGGGSVSVAGVDENGEPILNELANGQTGDWRIYDGNTPILNAFLPDSEKYFAKNGLTDNSNNTNNTNKPFNGSIQYGTVYDPLLTIINTDRDLVFNFGTKDNELSITNAAGLAVYGGGVTLNNFTTSSGSGYFGGTIYADGALNLNGGKNDIGLGSAADIYGSAVNITTDGKVTIYGDVTATGNGDNGTTEGIDTSLKIDGAGNITISASDVDVYGTLTSATTADYGNDVKIPGIGGTAVTWNPGNVSDPYAEMSDIADRFAHTTGKSNVNGNITINAGKDKDGNAIGDGNVNIYFGNQEQGLITTGGDLQVEATGNIFVDSDLDIGGNMTLASTGKDSEVLLTLTNIGKVQANRFAEIVEKALNGKDLKANRYDLIQAIVADVKAAYPGLTFDSVEAGYIVDALKNYAGDENNRVQAFEKLNNEIAVEYMHDFMHSFDNNTSNKINLNAASGNAKLTVDMWDYDNHKFDFKKYDTKFYGTETGHNFVNELNNLNVYINNKKTDPSKTVYIEVSNGDQLKGIQEAAKGNSDILGYNFALKGDINASHVEYYKAIGTGSDTGFTGTFDGRGNRIIGLNVTGDNAGIFSTVGTDGVVKDVNIYSGNFTGTDTAGAVAGVNNGRIEGVKTFGNTVEALGSINSTNIDGKYVGAAGGITGINSGTVDDVETTGSVIAGDAKDNNGALSTAGGIVGINNAGATISNSYSDSAATANANTNTTYALGGVVGVNNGDVQIVDSLGVTNGGDTNSSDIGGIIGINNGNMYSGYNESIVSGSDNVGGIIGTNAEGKKVENVVNATGVEGVDNVGGLIGVNKGAVTNGRNNGTITGINNVGGLVGNNASADSTLTNLVNDSSAEITGINNVGGIAGNNAGTITTGKADDEDEKANLINRGSITGHTNVGGVAGTNSGTIENANNDVELNVNPDGTGEAQSFGGIAGVNTGTITNATNTANVNADGASYVGGIVGKNDGILEDMAGNSGNVTGEDFVGGVAGQNNKDTDGVNASNTGVVNATGGGAGGIFGENNADVTNSELTNNGSVIGNGSSGTGGIFGVNSGDITYSSLKNNIEGQVIGTQNVGGLIGINTGKITGGRDANDSYYKYQIYNNGVINVGTWKDVDNDGVVDSNEITLSGQGSNIGGLIGNNADSGSLTAGYNTGAINASGSTNVGGIAGSNAGTIDQVFNTVMTENGQNQTITGDTNVGGLVGNNSGILSNAYNTTGVTGDDNFGNAVGNNTGEITNIYASNTTGILIGAGYENGKVYNAYSFVSDDKSATGVITGDAQKDSDSYEGFDFDTDGSGIWKNYDGYSNPLLKVFLTKAYYDSATGQLVAAADDFKAHQNAEGGLIFQGGLNNLWSIQIRFGNGNPNWLGYDLEGITYMPDKNWYYFLDDAPFDRNRDFRERKAEVNFVDGGMEI